MSSTRTPGSADRAAADLQASNVDIAREVDGQLYLSERTVEIHLSIVDRKLQLRSRSELREHL